MNAPDRLESMREHQRLRETFVEIVIVGIGLVVLAAYLAGIS